MGLWDRVSSSWVGLRGLHRSIYFPGLANLSRDSDGVIAFTNRTLKYFANSSHSEQNSMRAKRAAGRAGWFSTANVCNPAPDFWFHFLCSKYLQSMIDCTTQPSTFIKTIFQYSHFAAGACILRHHAGRDRRLLLRGLSWSQAGERGEDHGRQDRRRGPEGWRRPGDSEEFYTFTNLKPEQFTWVSHQMIYWYDIAVTVFSVVKVWVLGSECGVLLRILTPLPPP